MTTALVFLFGCFFYFLPVIVAVSRKHNNAAAIGVLNFFLGWTIAGWIVALVWSMTDNVKRVELQERY